MTTAVVFGASGFAGNELVRLLAFHPSVDGVVAVSREHAGKSVHVVHPDAPANLHIVYDNVTMEQANDADVVFLAIPGPDALDSAKQLTTRFIDLSPAHRFDADFTYGLPEANRDAIRTAKKVANPGCYATACILAALPLKDRFAAGSFDCKSGYSGGGKSKTYDHEDNVVPYGLQDHYQRPEIAKYVTRPYTFAPHVVDAFRGLLATVHLVGLHPDLAGTKLKETYAEFYKNEPLIQIQDEPPTLKSAARHNGARIGGFTHHGETAVLACAIDNLLKGAATQAVQNMNLMLGFSETEGLLESAMEPTSQND